MNKQLKVVFGLLLVLWLATACGANKGPGPSAWIDQPLEGARLPLAAVMITAHASDENGVAKFEFYIDEKPLVSVAGDNSILAMAQVNWNPTEAGTYYVRVRAVDSQGNVGGFAENSVQVGVVPPEAGTTEVPALEITEITPQPQITTPVPQEVTTEAPQEVTTEAPQVPQAISIELYAGSTSLNSGECTNIQWIVHNATQIFLDGSPVDAQGSQQVCPSSTTRYTISADGPAGSDSKAIKINVAAPIVTTEEVIIIPPEPIHVDTTGPSISVSVSKWTINEYQGSCHPDPTVTTVTASVSDDDSGINSGSVTVHWSLNGVEGSAGMSPASGNYSATIGPFNQIGSLSVWVTAGDNAGNPGTGNLGGAVTVQSPIC